MESPLVLTVLAKGTPVHPRFVIANQFGRVWTGDDWSDAEEDGLLFAEPNDVGRVCQELLLAQAGEKPVFRFLASIEIEIRSDKKPDWAEVAVWAIRAVQLTVDYDRHGSGPASGSVAVLKIDWATLKEIES
jgi:hypothetical protein